eukprot:5127559-Alexandrium_andersonii.AAC.1
MLKNTRPSANEARAGWTGLACRDACSVAGPASAVASASAPVFAGPNGPGHRHPPDGDFSAVDECPIGLRTAGGLTASAKG